MTIGATSVVNLGTYAGPFLSYEMAVATGVKTVHFLGPDAATAVLNSVADVSSVANGTIVGTPTYSTSYATFTGLTNYLQTGVASDNQMTEWLVVRSSAAFAANASYPGLIGNFSNTASGAGIAGTLVSTVKQARASRVVSVGGTPTNVTATLAWADPTVWTFLCAVFDGGNITLYNKTLGTSVAATNANAPILGGAPRIGSIGTLAAGTCDIAMAGIHAGAALSAADVEAIYQQIKAECAGFASPITI